MYEKRIVRYLPYERVEIPDIKNAGSLSPAQVTSREGELILKQLKPYDHLVLLDERGARFSSLKWASHLESLINAGTKSLVFVIGGAYGFSEDVYQRADEKLSLSDMTLSHQLVRLFFAEQLYRAMTIIKGEPYHNE